MAQYNIPLDQLKAIKIDVDTQLASTAQLTDVVATLNKVLAAFGVPPASS